MATSGDTQQRVLPRIRLSWMEQGILKDEMKRLSDDSHEQIRYDPSEERGGSIEMETVGEREVRRHLQGQFL